MPGLVVWPFRPPRLTSPGHGAPPRVWPFGPRRLIAYVAPVALSFPEALVAAIRADPTLSSLIGGRVYPGHLPELATYPAVAMQLTDHAYGQDLDGSDGTANARVEFVVESYYLLEARAVVRALFRLFNPLLRATLSGVLILAAVAEDDAVDYSIADDASDDGTFTDGITFTFLYVLT